MRLQGALPHRAGDEMAELIEALRSELAADREDRQTLRAEVAALRSELAETRALPPGANAERIDRALEVEMQGSSGDSPGASDGMLVRAARWLERLRR